MNDNVTVIVLLSIIGLLGAFLIVLSYLYFRYKRNKNVEIKKIEFYKSREKEIEETRLSLIKEFTKVKEEYEKIFKERNLISESNVKIMREYEKVAKLTESDAREVVLNKLKRDLESYRISEIQRTNTNILANIENESRHLLIETMERMAESVVVDKTSFSIPLPNESIKGKIIGKEGRNKKTIENITGANIIIDQNNYVTVSSFNPIRREIAVRTLQSLIKDGRIQPVRIEEIYALIKSDFETKLPQYAREALDRVKIYDIVDQEVLKLIGRLNFRTSYGQNVLNHLIESALLAEQLAKQMNLDAEIAKKCAFLHDIGKAIDFESSSKDHVTEGTKIAIKYGFTEEVTESIAKHHSSEGFKFPYTFITKTVDTISASRPGARIEAYEEYFKRMNDIETICKSIEGVRESFAVQSGREIRVMIESSIIKRDEDVDLIAFEIKNKINENLNLPGQITITVVREYRKQEKIN
jgi:ribonuclease Y